MASSRKSKLAALETFLNDKPQIQFAISTSPNYASLRSIYILDNQDVPLAIVRPQTAEDVAVLITYCTTNDIKFVIRSGGNNLFGLSCVQDALMIDMRDINYVRISEARSTAKIGGGILNGKLAAELCEEGLITAIGMIPIVGYVGWSSYGGYGPFSANYGLGLDNILGARVVNSKGEIVGADQRMLSGIRGAGGFIGVIVEVTIKVYPLKRVLAGVIIYESEDIASTFQKFQTGFNELLTEGLPLELSAQQVVANSPNGRILLVGFFWGSDDHEKGRIYLQKIEALASVVLNTVQSQTVSEYSDGYSALVPTSAYGTIKTISLRKLNDEVIAVMGRNLEKMPAINGCNFSLHDLRGRSATPTEGSVFGSREPHFVVELIGTPLKQEDREEALKWITDFQNDLASIEPMNILPGTYISLTAPARINLPKIYGSNYKTLLELKREYDPENFFDLAVPKFK